LAQSLTRRLVSAYIRTMILENGVICIIWVLVPHKRGRREYCASGCLQVEISLENLQAYLRLKIVGDCIDCQVYHMTTVLLGWKYNFVQTLILLFLIL
jgi:hypothetical protein